MLKKLRKRKLKLKMRKKKHYRKMLRLKEITITQKEEQLHNLFIYQHLYRMQLKSFQSGGCRRRRRLRGRLADYNGRSASEGMNGIFVI